MPAERIRPQYLLCRSEKDFGKKMLAKEGRFAWFSFKQVPKLNLSEQNKHDIVVGQRVIDRPSEKASANKPSAKIVLDIRILALYNRFLIPK